MQFYFEMYFNCLLFKTLNPIIFLHAIWKKEFGFHTTLLTMSPITLASNEILHSPFQTWEGPKTQKQLVIFYSMSLLPYV
jgi:hypothetical protein